MYRMMSCFANNNNVDEQERPLKRQDASNDENVPYFTLDDFLKRVGEYGLYQILLTLMIFYCVLPNSLLHLSFFFVAYNPGWQCMANSSVCNQTGVMRPADKQYKARCTMPRTDWQYPDPDDFSVVTQVIIPRFLIFPKKR